MSKHLLKPHDEKSVNVAKDRLLLDVVSKGKESVRMELLEKKFMNINEVMQKVTSSTEAWYKISTGNMQPIIKSARRF